LFKLGLRNSLKAVVIFSFLDIFLTVEGIMTE